MTTNKNKRTCLYSNKQYDKEHLIRLVKQNGKLVIDIKKNMLGRGYWIKLTNNCLSDPKLITILSKRSKSSVDQNLIEQLKELCH